MRVLKKEGSIQKVETQIEKEKRYGWNGNQSIPQIGKADNHLHSSGSGVVLNISLISMKKFFQIMQNIVKGKHDDESNSLKEKQSAGFPFSFILIGSIVVLFFFSSPLFLLLSIGNSFSQTDASDIVKAAEQEESLWEYNVGGRKYKQWYGIDGNWCAMFVSYCANECGYIDDGIMPKSASVANMATWYKQRGQFVYKTNDFGEYYEPKAGDIIFFQNGMSHVGIVVDYDFETRKVTVIEGNTGSSSTSPYHVGSRVKRKVYPITYKKITGYGQPNYPIMVL